MAQKTLLYEIEEVLDAFDHLRMTMVQMNLKQELADCVGDERATVLFTNICEAYDEVIREIVDLHPKLPNRDEIDLTEGLNYVYEQANVVVGSTEPLSSNT